MSPIPEQNTATTPSKLGNVTSIVANPLENAKIISPDEDSDEDPFA